MLRRLLLLACLGLLVVLTWTGVAAVTARAELQAGREALSGAEQAGTPQEVLVALAATEHHLSRARSLLNQPGPLLARLLPGVRGHLQAVVRTAEAGQAVVAGSREVLDVITDRPLLRDGAIDVDLLREAGAALERAEQTSAGPVAELDEVDTRRLLGVVGGPVREAQQRLSSSPSTFGRAGAAAGALAGVLGADGPRQLLVVLQNNAELRATGGLISVFAPVTAQDGRLELAPFQDVEDVAAPPGEAVRVPSPDDFHDLWGSYLADTTLWKNSNMSPDVPTSSGVLAEVAAATLPTRPDALLWLDVPAIAALVSAIGPQPLPDGSTLEGDDLVDRLLSRAYRDAPDDDAGQQERRRELRAVADAAVGGLLGGQSGDDVPVLRVAQALGRSAAGRHVAVWSSREQEQAQLVSAGIGGTVRVEGDDLSHMAVHNLGGGDDDGNKLDYYARRSVRVLAQLSDDAAQIVQQVSLRNTAPTAGLPRYVAGAVDPGTTRNLVALAVPADAEDVVLLRGGQRLDSPPRPQQDHAVVTDVVELPAGTEVRWELRYRLPIQGGRYRLAVVPQPLHRDAEVEVEVEAVDGFEVELPAGSPLAPSARGGALREPLHTSLDLDVQVDRAGLLARAVDAVQRFWGQPVPLPG